MGKDTLNIYCPNCGAPAEYDIVRQDYHCSYCGGRVTVEKARAAGQDRRRQHQTALRKTAKDYSLMTTSCTGCGATLVFQKDEVLSHCDFCGRSLVRKHYVFDDRLPQSVIPFGLTLNEAKEALTRWCDANRLRPEARHLRPLIPELKGYYLPYQLVRGPVKCRVSHNSASKTFEAQGYLREAFINSSSQLDNQLLDAMEPFDTEQLTDFDFGYTAGQQIKIPDTDPQVEKARLRTEAEETYRVHMERIWGSKALNIRTEVDPVVHVPVVLPVYYIAQGKVHAAVNGQTGKVSVRAERDSHYISLPWWVKGLALLLAACAATFGISVLRGFTPEDGLYLTGVLGAFYLFVFAFMFDSCSDHLGSITTYRRLFTSGEQLFRRVRGELVPRADVLTRKTAPPVFTAKLDGSDTPVTYQFRTLHRVACMLLLAVAIVFLPVIVALFLNGFDFARLTLGGSAVWFCVTVPTTPIVFIQCGIKEMYDNPWIYVFGKDGRPHRWHSRDTFSREHVKSALQIVLGCLFIPPWCFITWVFFFMCWLTAFGF